RDRLPPPSVAQVGGHRARAAETAVAATDRPHAIRHRATGPRRSPNEPCVWPPRVALEAGRDALAGSADWYGRRVAAALDQTLIRNRTRPCHAVVGRSSSGTGPVVPSPRCPRPSLGRPFECARNAMACAVALPCG